MIGTYNDTGIYSVLAPFQFTNGNNLPFYRDTRNSFCSLLQGKLEAFKHNEAIRQLLSQLTDTEINDYLLQPEVSHRLLFSGDDRVLQSADFFRTSLAAQLAKKTRTYDTALYHRLWSGNGDYLISFNEEEGVFEEYEAPKVGDRVPIDFFSPYCMGLSQDEINESPDVQFDLYSIEEAEDVFAHLESAVLPLADNQNFHELICQCNNVLMLKKQVNKNGRTPFISGSDGFFIGRTHVMNADAVGKEHIAEMFVHEGIHTILYMIEEQRPWMPGMSDAIRIGLNVPSNWSGNLLSVRSYFQAVFVWFGIWHLWKYALDNNLYDKARVEKRFAFVVNGFATLDLDKISKTYNIAIPDETVDAVLAAKRIVLKG
jgi:hypothetical protein